MSSKTHWNLVCPYCDEKTQSGHFVPPSCGDPGFPICESINRHEQENGMPKKKDWRAPQRETP